MYGAARAGVTGSRAFVAPIVGGVVGVVIGAGCFGLRSAIVEVKSALLVLGAITIALSALDLALPQGDRGLSRETSRAHTRSWLRWSVLNSAELSSGIATRPGMWLLYAWIAAMALAPNLATACIVGASYGALRSSTHLVLRRWVVGGRGVDLLRDRARRRKIASGSMFAGTLPILLLLLLVR